MKMQLKLPLSTTMEGIITIMIVVEMVHGSFVMESGIGTHHQKFHQMQQIIATQNHFTSA